MFMDQQHKTFRDLNFDVRSGEEGAFPPSLSPSSTSSATPIPTEGDRPLIVQFCANSPAHLLGAAKILEPHCDAIDINLGCPQEIARRGHYGAFLMEDWDLIYQMSTCPIPIQSQGLNRLKMPSSQRSPSKPLRPRHCQISDLPIY